MYSIVAEHIDFYYQKFHALKDISMEVEEHTVTAFIGPSGCGKSTFLRIMNRMNDLIDGTSMTGKMFIEGKDIYGRGVDVDQLRSKVGMVFQKPNPFPKSIYENVAYGLRVAGIRDRHLIGERVELSLKSAALWDEVKDRLDDNAYGLSGGQQQRLCIARCLAVQPDVILMDEPTSALDPIATSKIEDLIETLKNQYSIVIVTHSMQQAARISDKTAFFLMGEMIEYDDTNIIFTSPRDKRTEDYVTGRFG